MCQITSRSTDQQRTATIFERPHRRNQQHGITSSQVADSMTLVVDNSGRHYGGMGYDSMYASHLPSSSHFTDPWGAHGPSNTASSYHPLAKHESSRSNPISMPYPQVPVSAPSLASGSSYTGAGYGSSDILSLPQDIPRSTYGTEQSYTSASPATASFTPSYSSLGYAHSLAQQQQQQHHLRKLSDQSVSFFYIFSPVLTLLFIVKFHDPHSPALASLTHLEACLHLVTRICPILHRGISSKQGILETRQIRMAFPLHIRRHLQFRLRLGVPTILTHMEVPLRQTLPQTTVLLLPTEDMIQCRHPERCRDHPNWSVPASDHQHPSL